MTFEHVNLMHHSHIKHESFSNIWLSFSANLNALRQFSLKISSLAEALDQEKLDEFVQKSARFQERDVDEIRQEILSMLSYSDELEFEPDLHENPTMREVMAFAKSGELKTILAKWLPGRPGKTRLLSELVRMAFHEPAANGILLRRSALISLVSFYETLLFALLRLHYALPYYETSEDEQDGDKKLPKKLYQLIYFGSLKSRLEHIESLGVDMETLGEQKKKLVEIAERRNLFVHHNGVVSQRYLEIANRTGEKEILNRQFRVSKTYLLDAIDTLYVSGFILIQKSWRAWTSGHHKKADQQYVNVLFNLLSQERYDVAIRLSVFAAQFKMQWHESQMVAINHAIALRDTGQKDEMLDVLRPLDLSSASKAVEIALHILHERYDIAHIQIQQARKKRQLLNLYTARPLFRPLENDLRFQAFTTKD